MPVRPDIVVDWARSPRVVKVLAPSTEVTIQDLVDTLRVRETDYEALDDDPLLADATGKDDLGGGVKVGITATLNNAVVQFEQRGSSRATGTADAASDPTHLVDASATFITDGVEPGASIINLDDGSLASVIEVVTETELLTSALSDGTSNVWTTGDTYKVWNEVQCSILGGNLVALDADGDQMSPVLPSAFTQVVRTSSSSATLQDVESLEFASFNGGVAIKASSPYSGTAFPVGTLQQPVNNLPDAIAIAVERGLNHLHLLENLNIPAGSYTGYTFLATVSNVTVSSFAGADLTDSQFIECILVGDFSYAIPRQCLVTAITTAGSFFDTCTILGPLTLTGPGPVGLVNSMQMDPATPVVLDCASFTGSLSLRGWEGDARVINKSTAGSVGISLNGGKIVLDATVTAGSFVFTGVGTVEDDSTGTTVNTDGLCSVPAASAAVWNALMKDHKVPGSAASVLKTILGLSA